MTTTPEFHEERLGGIGSSDAGVIVGLGLRSRYSLWREKVGLDAPLDLSDDDRVFWGTVLEPVVAEEFKRRHPEYRVQRKRAAVRSKQHSFAMAHLDRTVSIEGVTPINSGAGTRSMTVPLEIKTSGADGHWTDGPPHYYHPQIQHQLACTGAPFAFVAVLLNGREYREFVIHRDQTYIDDLMAQEATFWNLVETRTEPELQDAADVIARFPKPSGTIEATPEDLDNIKLLKDARSRKNAAEKEEKIVRDILAVRLGPAEALLSHNKSVLTFKYSERRGFDQGALAAEHPELIEEYTRVGTSRRMV
jgi:putative phage-type endonuclease